MCRCSTDIGRECIFTYLSFVFALHSLGEGRKAALPAGEVVRLLLQDGQGNIDTTAAMSSPEKKVKYGAGIQSMVDGARLPCGARAPSGRTVVAVFLPCPPAGRLYYPAFGVDNELLRFSPRIIEHPADRPPHHRLDVHFVGYRALASIRVAAGHEARGAQGIMLKALRFCHMPFPWSRWWVADRPRRSGRRSRRHPAGHGGGYVLCQPYVSGPASRSSIFDALVLWARVPRDEDYRFYTSTGQDHILRRRPVCPHHQWCGGYAPESHAHLVNRYRAAASPLDDLPGRALVPPFWFVVVPTSAPGAPGA